MLYMTTNKQGKEKFTTHMTKERELNMLFIITPTRYATVTLFATTNSSRTIPSAHIWSCPVFTEIK